MGTGGDIAPVKGWATLRMYIKHKICKLSVRLLSCSHEALNISNMLPSVLSIPASFRMSLLEENREEKHAQHYQAFSGKAQVGGHGILSQCSNFFHHASDRLKWHICCLEIMHEFVWKLWNVWDSRFELEKFTLSAFQCQALCSCLKLNILTCWKFHGRCWVDLCRSSWSKSLFSLLTNFNGTCSRPKDERNEVQWCPNTALLRYLKISIKSQPITARFFHHNKYMYTYITLII